MAAYPKELEREIVLRDGARLRLRPIRSDDQGLGTVLLDALLEAAEARDIERFRAWVLANNGRMIDLLVRFTDVQERRTESGVTELVFRRKAPAGAR